ncbi:MAG: hypothetical protein J0M12_14760 [Deltaproteobacteria bacterium]|nr:hypothetical protein [Deltaproteobacteria bacterium]
MKGKISVFKLCRHILTIAALTLTLSACGGGSTGTGTGEIRSIEGQIVSSEGVPVSDVEVTLVQTGESSPTNTDGRFAIDTSFTGSAPQLLLESGSLSTTITLDASTVQGSALSVNVEIDGSNTAVLKVSKLQVRAQIIGACDVYFENNRTIRQANYINDGTVCTAWVQMYGDGNLLAGLPFVVQSSRCDKATWQNIAAGQTGSGPNAGVGQTDFAFFANAQNCRYRIVAPYKSKGLNEVIYKIRTFLEVAQEKP